MARRTYVIGHGNIRGFARPKYGKGTTTAVPSDSSSDQLAPVESSKTFLHRGSTGDDVKTMQKMLIFCGYSCGSYGADGDFGEMTESAVKKFQKDHGITANGYYNDETEEALKKLYDQMNTLAPPEPATTAKSASQEEVLLEETAVYDPALDIVEEEALPEFPKFLYTKKKPTTPMRKGAAKSKVILQELEPGTKVKALDSKINTAGNLWYKVSVNKQRGWIAATNLKDKP